MIKKLFLQLIQIKNSKHESKMDENSAEPTNAEDNSVYMRVNMDEQNRFDVSELIDKSKHDIVKNSNTLVEYRDQSNCQISEYNDSQIFSNTTQLLDSVSAKRNDVKI